MRRGDPCGRPYGVIEWLAAAVVVAAAAAVAAGHGAAALVAAAAEEDEQDDDPQTVVAAEAIVVIHRVTSGIGIWSGLAAHSMLFRRPILVTALPPCQSHLNMIQ